MHPAWFSASAKDAFICYRPALSRQERRASVSVDLFKRWAVMRSSPTRHATPDQLSRIPLDVQEKGESSCKWSLPDFTADRLLFHASNPSFSQSWSYPHPLTMLPFILSLAASSLAQSVDSTSRLPPRRPLLNLESFVLLLHPLRPAADGSLALRSPSALQWHLRAVSDRACPELHPVWGWTHRGGHRFGRLVDDDRMREPSRSDLIDVTWESVSRHLGAAGCREPASESLDL